MIEMPTLDPVTLVEITSEVVSAYLVKNHVPATEIPALIGAVHSTFAGLSKAPEPAAEPAGPLKPAVPVRKSVTEDHILSLIDGKPYRSLKRHIGVHGYTPESYRAAFGLADDYPMISTSYAKVRSEQAKKMGLGAMRKRG